MKRIINFCLTLSLIAIFNQVNAQNELPRQLGDDFSLEGTLDVFKNSESLEEFEKQLNKQDTDVNNLDLNEDGDVDYIRVEEHMEGNIHAIILQALISEKESQDIAVIEIEKTGEESATLQIVGDNYLYGDNYFVEPFEEVATSTGKGGPSADYFVTRIIVNVWLWPSVRHIYRPNYVVYRSPFRWRVYPRVWRPWRPLGWTAYNSRKVRFNRYYRPVKTHRVVRARKIYTPNRRTSNVVVTRSKTTTNVRKNRNGNTVVTKSKTTKKVKQNNTNKPNVTKRKNTIKRVKRKKERKAIDS